jgi:hypothetical protein
VPPRAPLAPNDLLTKFLEAGWTIVDETDRQWLLAPPPNAVDPDGVSLGGEPCSVPKKGKNISFALMDKARWLLNSRNRW